MSTKARLRRRRSKYNVDLSDAGKAARTRDGHRFHSKREVARYDELVLVRAAGGVRWFIRQPAFHLPGGEVYKADFLVFWSNGAITVEDVKGPRLQTYRAKKAWVESLYGIRIDEV